MIYEHLQCIGGFIILTGYIKQIRDIYDGVTNTITCAIISYLILLIWKRRNPDRNKTVFGIKGDKLCLTRNLQALFHTRKEA
mgnify:CR=1 FL=1